MIDFDNQAGISYMRCQTMPMEASFTIILTLTLINLLKQQLLILFVAIISYILSLDK